MTEPSGETKPPEVQDVQYGVAWSVTRWKEIGSCSLPSAAVDRVHKLALLSCVQFIQPIYARLVCALPECIAVSFGSFDVRTTRCDSGLEFPSQ
eukprot:75074-Rhodomonas_salina.1